MQIRGGDWLCGRKSGRAGVEVPARMLENRNRGGYGSMALETSAASPTVGHGMMLTEAGEILAVFVSSQHYLTKEEDGQVR
jgi:hypothetical protein